MCLNWWNLCVPAVLLTEIPKGDKRAETHLVYLPLSALTNQTRYSPNEQTAYTATEPDGLRTRHPGRLLTAMIEERDAFQRRVNQLSRFLVQTPPVAAMATARQQNIPKKESV